MTETAQDIRKIFVDYLIDQFGVVVEEFDDTADLFDEGIIDPTLVQIRIYVARAGTADFGWTQKTRKCEVIECSGFDLVQGLRNIPSPDAAKPLVQFVRLGKV